MTPGSRRTSALAAALVVLTAAAAFPGRIPPRADDPRPNVIVILTDDQSFDTLPSDPAAMPWLQARIADPQDHWTWFPNAFVNTPLCCPSRATLLTGLYSHHTGVQDNGDGHLLDEDATLAVRLHDAGYRTGLIGKYLNRYPFGRGPYVPPGWDRWVGKGNRSAATTYYGYPLVDQGVPLTGGLAPADYATDLLAREAAAFVRTAPASQPYFLLFTPSAPHAPQTPAPRYADAFDGLQLPRPPSFGASDVEGKPPWIRDLPPIGPGRAAALDAARIRERQTLLAVDDAVRQIVHEVAARGDLGNTVIFFLTDNGLEFGEHGLTAKSCPYVECVRTPFAVYVPEAPAGTDPALVSNVDLAPTIASLAGLPPAPTDGVDLAPLLRGEAASSRPAVLTEYHGDATVPAWQSVRTADLAYIRTGSFEELYDLTGSIGSADPFEMRNRAGDPAYLGALTDLRDLLRTMSTRPAVDG